MRLVEPENILVVNAFQQPIPGYFWRRFHLDFLIGRIGEASRYDCFGFPLLLAVRDFRRD